MVGKKEFRISLPNQPGQLALVGETLGRRGVNILTVAAIGAANPVIALVTGQVDQTREALQELGLSFQEVELLSVKLPHRPGELGIFAKKLGDTNINIESIYLLGESDGEAELAFTVSDMARAKQVLGL